jgi:Flp pilus assembly protein TadD
MPIGVAGADRTGRPRAKLLAAVALAALLLTGCASKPPETTGSIAVQTGPLNEADIQKALTYWGERHARDGKDKAIALNYAAALRRANQTPRAIEVIQAAIIANPNDKQLMAALGKALASNGEFERALKVIQQAQTRDKPDWGLLSAQAAILDQLGRYDDARRLYTQALALAPNEPSVLSNLGMSHLLSGNLPEAEKVLRTAIALPGGDSRIRQNLALVVGLQGRFDEAEKIAGAELSPDQAAANIAYLRSMLSQQNQQQNSWQKLRDADAANG